MLSRFAFLLGFLVLASAATPAAAQTASCQQFKDTMVKAAAELKPEFIRPMIVSKGLFSGLDQFDMVNQALIDGVLRCRGDAFVSFEVKITLPADAALLSRFDKAQEAALVSALRWPSARAQAKARSMAADAAEYLRASEERGDVSLAGKTEEHEANLVDLGLIWTPGDRTFIVLVGS